MYSKITIVGNLGRDPEMKYMNDGTAVTSFSVATSRGWTGKDGQRQEETLWFRVSVWGRQAETANQYLAKGRRVLVEGTLQGDPATGGPRLWQGKDGNMNASFEIRADNVTFLGGSDAAESGKPEMANVGGEVADDIPF